MMSVGISMPHYRMKDVESQLPDKGPTYELAPYIKRYLFNGDTVIYSGQSNMYNHNSLLSMVQVGKYVNK